MEIRAASFAQVERGRDGRLVTVDDDVLGIAQDLKKIDDKLHLRWSEAGEYFVIYEVSEDGNEHLVLTSQDLNPAVLDRVRQVSHSSYNYAEELDRLDAQVDRDFAYGQRQRFGEISELLSFAVRKDLGVQSRVYLNGGKKTGKVNGSDV
jgi:hypothetical protein